MHVVASNTPPVFVVTVVDCRCEGGRHQITGGRGDVIRRDKAFLVAEKTSGRLRGRGSGGGDYAR